MIANANLFGLSTPEVCPAFAVASKAVVSYTTFSPLPCGGLFSVALSVSRRAYCLPVRKQVALCCPDFPLGFCQAIRRLVAGKFSNFCAFFRKF